MRKQSRISLLSDVICNGVLDLFRSFEMECNVIRVLDTTQVLTQEAKKRQLVKGITSQFFRDQLLTHLDNLKWTFDCCESLFRSQIRADSSLDVTRKEVVTSRAMSTRSLKLNGTCWTCGKEPKDGYSASNCPEPYCEYCRTALGAAPLVIVTISVQ